MKRLSEFKEFPEDSLLIYVGKYFIVAFLATEFSKDPRFVRPKQNHLIVGAPPVGLKNGNWSCSAENVFVLEEAFIDVCFDQDDLLYRIFHEDKMYEANEGVPPEAIVNSVAILGTYQYLMLDNKKLPKTEPLPETTGLSMAPDELDKKVLYISKVAHQAVRALQQQNYKIGQPDYDDISEEANESVALTQKMVYALLRNETYTDYNPLSPQELKLFVAIVETLK